MLAPSDITPTYSWPSGGQDHFGKLNVDSMFDATEQKKAIAESLSLSVDDELVENIFVDNILGWFKSYSNGTTKFNEELPNRPWSFSSKNGLF